MARPRREGRKTLCYWRADAPQGWTAIAIARDWPYVVDLARRLHQRLGVALHLHAGDDTEVVIWSSEEDMPPHYPDDVADPSLLHTHECL